MLQQYFFDPHVLVVADFYKLFFQIPDVHRTIISSVFIDELYQNLFAKTLVEIAVGLQGFYKVKHRAGFHERDWSLFFFDTKHCFSLFTQFQTQWQKVAV